MSGADETCAAQHLPGVITSLAKMRGSKRRIAVHVDGEYAFELAAAVVEHSGLRAGQRLEADVRDRLLQEDLSHRAQDKALGLLAHRERCRKEVESRLSAAGFEQGVVSETVSWLQGRGYLDDERFAVAFARDRLRAGWGVRRVKAELVRRGVDRDIADRALRSEEAMGEAAGQGVDAVVMLARKRFGDLFASDPNAAKRRLAGFLARRGYDWDEIDRIVRVVAEAASAEAGAGATGTGRAADEGHAGG